ncbi:hypothetical protein [Lentisalinibacter sediminis]|uniref:hypothetical protein n=1 Tax=Lentisalinibacter sediminis TaxID=2992237 RepID=UPI0038661A4E
MRGQAIGSATHPLTFLVTEIQGIFVRLAAIFGETGFPAHGIGAQIVRTPYAFGSTLLDTADLLVGVGDDGGATALAGAYGITGGLLGLQHMIHRALQTRLASGDRRPFLHRPDLPQLRCRGRASARNGIRTPHKSW